MNERITLISLLDKENLEKINKLLPLSQELCKVPFGKNVTDRMLVDTLPLHFTLFACSIKEKEKVLNILSQITFPKLTINITGISIMNGKENSSILYFEVEQNKELKTLQQQIYKKMPVEKYNPEKFKFHITIHIDQDKKKIEKLKGFIRLTSALPPLR